MHISSIFAAVGALATLAAAVPMPQLDKRDIVWVTHTNVDIVTVPMTTTVWLTAGEEPTEAAKANNHGHHHHKHEPITSHLTSTMTVQPNTPASTPESVPETTPVTPTTPAVVPTTPATTAAEPQIPTTTSEVQSAPTSTASNPPPASNGGGSSGQTTTGEITYYTPGLGSCGITSTSSDLIVAMPVGVMTAALGGGGNPNANPLCGKSITLTSGSTSVTATIVDTCPSCADDHIDTAPAVFEKFGSLGEGVINGVSWTLGGN